MHSVEPSSPAASFWKALPGALALAAMLGCSNPADNVPAASVNAAPNATAQAGPAAGAKTYAFGTNSSSIEFIGSKVTGSHHGGFRNFAGEFKVADGKLAGAGHKVVIDTRSLWSDNQRLTGHLKNPDFFHVEQFPTATFEATAVEPKGNEWTVTGNLNLHGITRQISFPATIAVTDDSVHVASEFSLNRFDFDMKYPGKADDLIRQEVVLKLNIKAAPGQADFSSVQPEA